MELLSETIVQQSSKEVFTVTVHTFGLRLCVSLSFVTSAKFLFYPKEKVLRPLLLRTGTSVGVLKVRKCS